MVDAGFSLALANRRDTHHPAAVARMVTNDEPLITTWRVMTEFCHLLRRLGPASPPSSTASPPAPTTS